MKKDYIDPSMLSRESRLTVKFNNTPKTDISSIQSFGKKFNLETKILSKGSKGIEAQYVGKRKDCESLLNYLYNLNQSSGNSLFREVQKLFRDSKGVRMSLKEKINLFKKAKETKMALEDAHKFKDVDPREGESKKEFLARFMNETKSEYPDEKQRYAVANSYWEKKGKDSIKDSIIKQEGNLKLILDNIGEYTLLYKNKPIATFDKDQRSDAITEFYNCTNKAFLMNEYGIKDSIKDDRFYFGKEEYEKYGDKVYRALRGKIITKHIDEAKQPGGLEYEARKLGMDMYDLLGCLEGMCYNGKARELPPGDSYKVNDSIKDAEEYFEVVTHWKRDFRSGDIKKFNTLEQAKQESKKRLKAQSSKDPINYIEIKRFFKGDDGHLYYDPTKYWRATDSIKDSKVYIVYKKDINDNHIIDDMGSFETYQEALQESNKLNKGNKDKNIYYMVSSRLNDSIHDEYTSFLGNYGFDFMKGSGDYETWYLKYDDEDFNKLVNRMRAEYPKMIVSASPSQKTIYIQKSKYGVKDEVADEDIDSLSKEEQQAIDDYKKAISGTTDVKLLELYSHILREEIEHLEELQGAKQGEFEDSKIGDLTLNEYLPEIEKLVKTNKSGIIEYGKALANKKVSNPNYKDFATRFTFDIFYKMKWKIPSVKEMSENSGKDSYIGSLFKQAFKNAGISLNEEDYKLKDSIKDKESASVREAISLLEGQLAKEYGYTLDRNYINFGDGSRSPISTQVYMRLKELGYNKQSMNKSNIVKVPNMNLKQMQDYCENYKCMVTQVSGREYKLEGRDAPEVIKELKADGYVKDSIKDANPKYILSVLNIITWKNEGRYASDYYGRYDSEKILDRFFKKHPEYDYDNQYFVSIEEYNGQSYRDSIKDARELKYTFWVKLNIAGDTGRQMERILPTNDDNKAIELMKNEFKSRIKEIKVMHKQEIQSTNQYLLVKGRRSYDPEGLNIGSDTKILYKGTLERCTSELNNLYNKEKNEKANGKSVSPIRENSFEVYYTNSQNKYVYQVIKEYKK